MLRPGPRHGHVLQPLPIDVQPASGGVASQPGLQTLSAHDALPVHATSHAHALPQVTSPLHAPLPEQVTLHAAEPQFTSPLHAPLPAHATLQLPVPQVTSLPHEPLPVQVALQLPEPQVIAWQVLRPLQVTVHDAASLQKMPRLQVPWTAHSTSQFQPAGHATGMPQLPVEPQSIVQECLSSSHDVHCCGQLASTPASGGITQSPSTQVRPSMQRC
jgi:hypothetical protein